MELPFQQSSKARISSGAPPPSPPTLFQRFRCVRWRKRRKLNPQTSFYLFFSTLPPSEAAPRAPSRPFTPPLTSFKLPTNLGQPSRWRRTLPFPPVFSAQVRTSGPSGPRENCRRTSLAESGFSSFQPGFSGAWRSLCGELIISDCTAALSQMGILYSSDHRLYTFISSHSPQRCKCHVAG